jgi:YHS domain-containing protein
MKNFQVSLTAAVVAAVVIVATPAPTPALGSQGTDFANGNIGKDQMLLAQAETSGQKKALARKSRPLVNCDKTGVILKGYDPVAYFKQNRAVKGNPKYSSTYGGAIYYFASAEDKAEFEKTPAKYVPQYGGFCANSMSERRIADIDPNQFFIYKGKLYLCMGSPELKTFTAKPDVKVQAADKNWELYQPPTSPGFRRQLGS